MKIIIRGRAGFVGSILVRMVINGTDSEVLNIDKLIYALHLHSLDTITYPLRYQFQQADICYLEEINRIFNEYQLDAITHLAVESHVDRSIYVSTEFTKTMLSGIHTLIDEARQYWQGLEGEQKENFQFKHISIDEVHDEIRDNVFFIEETTYDPLSPYSSSTATSDHIRAWHQTCGLPRMITNCLKNYWSFQFSKKLIPIVTLKPLSGVEYQFMVKEKILEGIVKEKAWRWCIKYVTYLINLIQKKSLRNNSSYLLKKDLDIITDMQLT